MVETFVIVGGGMAGASAIDGLRGDGFDGRIVLVGEEAHLPYERPPLSKRYLHDGGPSDALGVRDAPWYAEHAVELRLGERAERLDAAGGALVLASGERLAADGVLLATGGRVRELPGAPPSARVRYLRTIEDADALRPYLGAGRRVVVVGAGFIGGEVASTARELGAEVTVLELLDTPLQQALGVEMGEVCAALQRDHGVDLRTGEGVEKVVETDGGVTVRTTTGAEVAGDVVVVGIGMRPNAEIAERSGLEVGDGVAVDAQCRTSQQAVWAAGDVAWHEHPLFGRRLRVEHHDNALRQGRAAARSMLGGTEPYSEPHWFWSDQFGTNIQYAGHAPSWDEVVVRGSVEERAFAAFYLVSGVVRAVLGFDRAREVQAGRRLVASAAQPEPAELGDESVDLREIVKRHR